MVSPKTKRKATKKGKSTPGRRNGRSASSSPNKKKQNKTTEPETKGGMDIDAIAGANGAEAAAAAKADNENVGGKPPDEATKSKETKDKEDDDTPKIQEIDEEIFVTGPDGKEAAIEVVGPSAAREVLGVFQAADSNMAEQMQELKAKVDDRADDRSMLRRCVAYLLDRLLGQNLRRAEVVILFASFEC